jgi:hypothetical protein
MESGMTKHRLNIEISGELARLIDELSEGEGTTKTEIIRRGLSVMKAFRSQIKAGRKHIGFTRDPDKLDTELLGILSDHHGESAHAG